MTHVFEMANTSLLGTSDANTVRVCLVLCDPSLSRLSAHVVLRQCVGTVSFHIHQPTVCVGQWAHFTPYNCGRLSKNFFYFDVPLENLLPHAPDSPLYIHTSIRCRSQVLGSKIPAVLEEMISDLCGCCRVRDALATHGSSDARACTESC